MLLGMLFQHENVAFIATIPMVVSASVTFPLLLLSLFWGGFTTRGAISGALVGLFTSVVLIVLGPQVWVSVLGNSNPCSPTIIRRFSPCPWHSWSCFWCPNQIRARGRRPTGETTVRCCGAQNLVRISLDAAG